MSEMGKVYLVGSGCGAADLITLRGLRLLRQCDVVIYDDLIDPDLLQEVPEEAEKLYMGKRQGRHSAHQEDICAALIHWAQMGRTVVRLKGGDPFVFGRGGEEAMALEEAGIPWEVVPGVTSAVAVPAMAGIPVTCRGVSRSVHIVTAHTADAPDGMDIDFKALAALSGTLVFLMGLSRLERIAQRLIEAGLPTDTPAAVVSGGKTSCAAVRGTLEDIGAKARAAGLQPPAVIVVGASAGLELGGTGE